MLQPVYISALVLAFIVILINDPSQLEDFLELLTWQEDDEHEEEEEDGDHDNVLQIEFVEGVLTSEPLLYLEDSWRWTL